MVSDVYPIRSRRGIATAGVLSFSRSRAERGLHEDIYSQPEAVDEVIARIDTLQPATQRQWGKMDVAQMMAHCSAALDMASGRLNPPRILIGRMIGPFVKPIYYEREAIFARTIRPTRSSWCPIRRDFLREQEQLKSKIRQFHEGGEARCTKHPHPFFGAA